LQILLEKNLSMKKNNPVIVTGTKIINLTRFAVLGFLIPIVFSFVVYAGFNSNYTSQGLTLQGFEEQYFNGVYRYRILGRSMLLETYELVKTFDLPVLETSIGDPQFYSAYFYLNTLFLCLTCATLFFVLGGNTRASFSKVDLPLLFICSLMSLGQFVVVPYDTLSYFLLALSALVVLRSKKSVWQIIILCALVILATLTRESAVLIVSFYFSVDYSQILRKSKGLRWTHEQVTLLAISASFTFTYLILRLILGFSQSLFQNLTIVGNSNLRSAFGLLFLIGMVFLMLASSSRSKNSVLFAISSLPYLIPMGLIAVTWEIRLWVPFLMLLLILVLENENKPGKEVYPENTQY